MNDQFKLILLAGVAGSAVALKGDWATFKAFKSFDEFAAYDWKVALWRAVQGFVIGALPTLASFAATNQAVVSGSVSL